MSRNFRLERESRRRDNKIEKERKFKGNFRSNEERKTIECWECGVTGHYRSECPAKKGEN